MAIKTGPRTQRGFTLIELVVAGAVAAILATYAINSYSKYVLRSNRAVVRAMLVDLAAKQDVVRIKTRAFATTFSALNGVAATSFYVDRAGVVNTSSTGLTPIYQVAFAAGNTVDTYTFMATSYGNQTKDKDCAQFMLTSTGVKSATNAGSASNPDCWGR